MSVPAGLRRQCLARESGHTDSKQQRPMHTQQVEKGRSSEDRARVTTHTQSVETREAQKRQQVATRSVWKGKEEQPAFNQTQAPSTVVRHPLSRSSTCGDAAERHWTEPRWCFHGRTQYWASAIRSSCHRRKHVSLDVTTGHMTRPAPSTATPKEDSSRRRDRRVHTDSAR